jgi:hypothetical protein
MMDDIQQSIMKAQKQRKNKLKKQRKKQNKNNKLNIEMITSQSPTLNHILHTFTEEDDSAEM